MSTNFSQANKLIDRLFFFLIIALLVYFLIDSLSIALTQPFSFDGAINAQVAKEVANNFTYATTYNGIQKFDPIIQTGIPVILPVAIFFKLFGVSFESGLLVNTIYSNLLILAIVYYLKSCLKLSNPFIFLAILFFISIPDLNIFAYGLYGEIPTLFYLLVTIILIHKFETSPKLLYVFLAGLALGLGYLTKTVILISLPALLFAEVFDYFSENRRIWSIYFKKAGIALLGFLTPVLIFELYKLISLGGGQYLAWWNDQFTTILMQAGVKSGFSDTQGIITKLSLHLELLSSYLKMSKTILGVILLVLFISFLLILAVAVYNYIATKRQVTGKITMPQSAIIILTITISYFGWWLIITSTQKAWYRRIFDGTILLSLCVVIFLWVVYTLGKKLLERSASGFTQPLFIGLSTTLLILIGSISIYNFIQTKNGFITFKDSANKIAAVNAGSFINSLPTDTPIYGYGWWQAPVISFTSGRIFRDFSKIIAPDDYPELHDIYLAIDNFDLTTPNLYTPILNEYRSELVFVEQNIYIYKFNSR